MNNFFASPNVEALTLFPQGGTHHMRIRGGGVILRNFRQPKGIILASQQPISISSFYALKTVNKHEISRSVANLN